MKTETLYEAVCTGVQTELSREAISLLLWQYAMEAITHSNCRRFVCLSDCRQTAVSMDTTLERSWAMTGIRHHQQPCTHTHGPSHPFSCKVSAQPFWSARELLLVSGCGTSPAVYPRLGAGLCTPAQQHQLKAHNPFCRRLGSRRHARSPRPFFLLLMKLSCSVLFLYTASASHSQGSIAF